MLKAKTHLGNSQLHKVKSVMVTGGQIPRAKVMDQTRIDGYLMRGLLNLTQPRAGEVLLGQAAKAGAWPTGVNWGGSGGGSGNYVPVAGFSFGGTLAAVQDKYGWFHSYVVKEVVIHDWDVSASDFRPDFRSLK